MFRDKVYWQKLLIIALPITLQNLVMNGLNMVDVMMIGQLGDVSVAAVGLATEISNILNMAVFGITSGGAIFAAQYWGKKDVPNLRRVLGISLLVSVLASIVFMLIAFLFPKQALGIYTNDQAVIGVGTRYFRMVATAYTPWVISYAFAAIHRSAENVKLPILVSIIALGLKTAINFLLINGNLGFPAMGVEGAALATVISRSVEFIGMILFTYLRKTPLAATFKEIFYIDFSFLKRFFKTAFPVIVNETLWSMGMSAYSVVYARISTESIAAYNVSRTIDALMYVFFIGIGNACAIMVGNKIGSGEDKTAFNYSKWSLGVALWGGIVVGAILFGISGPVLNLYNISELAKSFAVIILRITGLTMWMRGINMVIFVGIMRAGGDTRYGLFSELISMWGVGVPLSFFAGFVLHLPVYWVYLIAMSDELVKMLIGLRRVFSGRWINNLIHGFDTPQPAELPVTEQPD